MSFELTQLSRNVFAIKEKDDRNFNPLCYLIQGRDRVILIDTGCGCGNLYTYVRGLDIVKDIQILVINTHNHREQTGGNWRFSTTGKFGLGHQVEDLCASKKHKFYTRLMDSSWHWEVHTYKVTRWLTDGEVIPLGGGHDSIQPGRDYFKILWTPGHTPDSLVIWYEREQRLFVGDLFYRFNDILFTYPHVDIKAYESSVRRILNLVSSHPNSGKIRFSSAKNDMDELCLPLLKLYHRFLLAVLAGTHIGTPLRIDEADGWRYETRDKAMKIILSRDTIGNEHILSSPLFPPLYALSIDYTWVIVFSVIDLFFCDVPFFKKAKIQKNRKVTWDLMKKSLYLQMWNQLLWIYPMALVQLIWVPPTELPVLAPTLWEMTSQCLIFFISFDFSYFWFHYIHHKVKFLYRWCHSVHHMYSSPFAAAAQHLHPFELFFVASFITMIPWVFPTHCLTYWLWFLIAQSVSYEVHIGYDFPFALHRFLPFYSGAPAHDMHHFRPLTCFEPWFNYLDKLMGYHITYEDLKKMAETKSRRFGLYSKEEEQGLEKIN